MKRATLEAINEARRAGRAVVRAVDLASGEERLLDPSSATAPRSVAPPPKRPAPTEAHRSRSKAATGFSRSTTLRSICVSSARFTSRNCSRSMAALAEYGVRVVDPRAAFATAERFPGVALSHDWPDEALRKIAARDSQRARRTDARSQGRRSRADRGIAFELFLHRRVGIEENPCGPAGAAQGAWIFGRRTGAHSRAGGPCDRGAFAGRNRHLDPGGNDVDGCARTAIGSVSPPARQPTRGISAPISSCDCGTRSPRLIISSAVTTPSLFLSSRANNFSSGAAYSCSVSLPYGSY